MDLKLNFMLYQKKTVEILKKLNTKVTRSSNKVSNRMVYQMSTVQNC